jgi:hypothetical protein
MPCFVDELFQKFNYNPNETPGWNVTPHLWIKVEHLCYVLLPGSLDSTTVQNIVIIADSVIYYIANPDTIVFKLYRNSLATWTCLNTRV